MARGRRQQLAAVSALDALLDASSGTPSPQRLPDVSRRHWERDRHGYWRDLLRQCDSDEPLSFYDDNGQQRSFAHVSFRQLQAALRAGLAGVTYVEFAEPDSFSHPLKVQHSVTGLSLSHYDNNRGSVQVSLPRRLVRGSFAPRLPAEQELEVLVIPITGTRSQQLASKQLQMTLRRTGKMAISTDQGPESLSIDPAAAIAALALLEMGQRPLSSTTKVVSALPARRSWCSSAVRSKFAMSAPGRAKTNASGGCGALTPSNSKACP